MGVIFIYDSWESFFKNVFVIILRVVYLGYIKELDVSGYCVNETFIFFSLLR